MIQLDDCPGKGEIIRRHYAGVYFDVYSAGLESKGIHPLTTRVMDRTISPNGKIQTPARLHRVGRSATVQGARCAFNNAAAAMKTAALIQ
jgi:hypothetical protein